MIMVLNTYQTMKIRSFRPLFHILFPSFSREMSITFKLVQLSMKKTPGTPGFAFIWSRKDQMCITSP